MQRPEDNIKEKFMAIHSDAGKPVSKENLTDIAELVSCYYQVTPDVRLRNSLTMRMVTRPPGVNEMGIPLPTHTTK